MTDHLPDCDDYAFSGAGYHPKCERICICRQVRRIEKRVLDAAREAVMVIESDRDALVWWERFGDNPDDPDEVTVLIDLKRAIAAIDALKEKR